MNASYTLSIDTATGPCSVAVLKENEVLARRCEMQPARQAGLLVPMIEETLQDAGITYRYLNEIISTVGPGTFTGLRIGLATARAMGFALSIPVKGVTTLAALAQAAASRAEGRRILALVNAGKKEAYYQWFETAPVLSPAGEAKIGSGGHMVQAVAEPALAAGFLDVLPEHSSLTLLSSLRFPDAAHAALAARCGAFILPLEPLYIRPPDAVPSRPIASGSE